MLAIRAEVAELADAQDLGTVRATLPGLSRSTPRHSEPKRKTAKLASVYAAFMRVPSGRFLSFPIARKRSPAHGNQEPTATTTATGHGG